MIKSLTKLLKTSHILSYKHILGFDSRGLICGWLLIIFSFSLKRNKRHVKGLSWYHHLLTTALQSESKQAPKRSSSTDTPQTPQLMRGNSPSNVGKIQVSFPRREKLYSFKIYIFYNQYRVWYLWQKNVRALHVYLHWEIQKNDHQKSNNSGQNVRVSFAFFWFVSFYFFLS